MNDKIDNYMKEKGEKLLDLGINTINIYEFEGADYLKKRQKDKETLDQMRYDYHDHLKLERQHKKSLGRQQQMSKKVVVLPDFQLYDDKDKLENILSKEANGELLTDQE